MANDEEIQRLRLEKARLQARCSVFMQAMAWLSKQDGQVPVTRDRVKVWVEAADNAFKAVQPEDLVRAKLNRG